MHGTQSLYAVQDGGEQGPGWTCEFCDVRNIRDRPRLVVGRQNAALVFFLAKQR